MKKYMVKYINEKVILCHTTLNKSFFLSHELEVVETNNKIISTIKKANAPTNISTPKQGSSWSVELLRNNPGSRWITFRGHKVLIRGNADGTATVVYSGNPSHEHLRIIPKEHKEYAKIKEAKQKSNEQKAGDSTEVKRTITEVGKKITKQKQNLIVNKITEGEPSGVEKDIPKIGNEKIDIPSIKKEDIPEKNKNFTKEFDKLNDKEKQKTLDELLDHAKNKITQDHEDSVKYSDFDSHKKVNIKSQNPLLDGMEIDKETAINIVGHELAAKQIKKEAVKDIKKNDITSLGNIGITDYDLEALPSDPVAITETVLREKENRIRAEKNTQFYNNLDKKLEGRSKQISNEITKGAHAELYAMSSLIMDGNGFSKDMLKFLGIDNATKILASLIDKKTDRDKIEKDLEKVLSKKNQIIVNNTLDAYQQQNDIINAYKEQSKDIYDENGNLVSKKMLAAATANANIARVTKEQNKELGNATGSLQTAASLLENIREIKDTGSNDMVLDGGLSKRSLIHKLKKFGLIDSVNIEKGEDGRYKVTIPKNQFNKILSNNTTNAKIDEKVKKIKEGATVRYGKDSLAAGQPDSFIDFMTEKEFNKNNDKLNQIRRKQANGTNLTEEEEKFYNKYNGYNKYVNTKGEEGYTSSQKEGTILYGKKMKARLDPHQQKAVAMANSQKRYIMDFGAGTGKTIAHLASISDLKAKGKLHSVAVMSPPSRLVKEFFKDQEKFFPNLKMLNLDEVKGGIEAKRKAIEDVKKNGYDIIISGHDSIKSGMLKNDNPTDFVDNKMKELSKAINTNHVRRTKKQKELVSKYKSIYSKKDGINQMRELFNKQFEDNKGLPEIIANVKPSYLGVDEAHEVWGEKTQSQKSESLRKMADSANHFVPSTGTLMRSGIGDFANIMNLTRPDLVPDVDEFKNKYAQGITGNVTEGIINNEMAKEVDAGILTHKTDITPQKKRNIDNPEHEKLDLSLNQKIAYANNENMYRQDRNFNKKNGLNRSFGVWDIEKNRLITHPNGNIKDIKELRNHDTLQVNESDSANQTKEALQELKKAGYKNADKYKLVELGGTGAAARRDSMHDNIINNGDYKNNVKVQNMLQDIEENPDHNHGVFYTNRKTKNTITDALLSKGYKREDIAFIDADNNKKQNNQILSDYMTGKKKILVGSQVAMTGLNIQKMDTIHFIGVPKTYNQEQQAEARAHRKGRENYANESNPAADVRILHHETNTVIDNNARKNITRQKKEAAKIKQYEENYGLKQEAQVSKSYISKSIINKKRNIKYIIKGRKAASIGAKSPDGKRIKIANEWIPVKNVKLTKIDYNKLLNAKKAIQAQPVLRNDPNAKGQTALKKESLPEKYVFRKTTGKKKVERVMQEFKEGNLKDKYGKIITNRKQAIAIALNEAGLSKDIVNEYEQWQNDNLDKNIIDFIDQRNNQLFIKNIAIGRKYKDGQNIKTLQGRKKINPLKQELKKYTANSNVNIKQLPENIKNQIIDIMAKNPFLTPQQAYNKLKITKGHKDQFQGQILQTGIIDGWDINNIFKFDSNAIDWKNIKVLNTQENNSLKQFIDRIKNIKDWNKLKDIARKMINRNDWYKFIKLYFNYGKR